MYKHAYIYTYGFFSRKMNTKMIHRFDMIAKYDFRIESYVTKCKFDYSILNV